MHVVKKILIVIAVLVLAPIVALLAWMISESGIEVIEHDEPARADVIMPTKSSRPGCEADDTCYIPSDIAIPRGGEVTWLNEDSAFHSVTSGSYDSQTDLFDSGYLNAYESFTYRFDDAGTYEYFCTLHPWMEGTVVVE